MFKLVLVLAILFGLSQTVYLGPVRRNATASRHKNHENHSKVEAKKNATELLSTATTTLQTSTTINGSLVGEKNFNLKGYPLFFNGYWTSTDTAGRFQLQAHYDLKEQPLYFLVSSSINWGEEQQSKTIKVPQQGAKEPYKFYEISVVNEQDSATGTTKQSLNVQAKDLQEMNFEIPIDRTLILPINGFFVKEMATSTQTPFINGSIFQLPKIVLEKEQPLQESKTKFLLASGCDKKSIDFKVNKILRRGTDKAFLRFSDWMMFHEPVVKLAKNTTNSLNRKVDVTLYAKA